MTTTYLPSVQVQQIRAHGANPRRQVGDVTELAASISAHGLLEPLVVAPINGVEFLLIAGHRRLAAAKAAGIATVPCMLREDLDTPPKQLEAMLVENTQRVDLSPVEEAAAYQSLLAFPGYTVTKVAKATGRAAKTIRSRVALASLPEKTQSRVHDGSITLADAEVLAEFVDADPNVYANLVAQVGTSNFAWTVTRIREVRAAADAFTTIAKWCTERGYETTQLRQPNSTTVIASWKVPKDVGKVLADLTCEAGYVLYGGGQSWALHEVVPVDIEDITTDDGGASFRAAARAELDAAAKDSAARNADLETARQTRVAWALGRCRNLFLTPAERLAVLRLLVAEMLESYDVSDDSLLLAAAPQEENFIGDGVTPVDIEAIRQTWAENLTENEAWRALVVLGWDLGRCGSERWPHDHKQSIRLAIDLGYTPSDVEMQLLAGDGA